MKTLSVICILIGIGVMLLGFIPPINYLSIGDFISGGLCVGAWLIVLAHCTKN
jgi:hypothetical protein